MSNVRSDLEIIVNNANYLSLFEERLKKSYNYQNIAFWLALRDLRMLLEGGCEVASDPVQDRFEHVGRTFIDTESAQSIALSFKERFKRARTQPAEEVKKAINQAQLEVEMLLVGEVKAFLAEAPPPQQKSPRLPASVAGLVSPRSDRSPSEATQSPISPGVTRTTTPSAVPRKDPPPVPGGAGGGSVVSNAASRSASVAAASPTKAAQRAVLKGSSANNNNNSSLGSSQGQIPQRSPPTTPTAQQPRHPYDVGPLSDPGPNSRFRKDTADCVMSVLVWGDNTNKQLGMADEVAVVSPSMTIPPLTKVSFVQCTDTYSAVVTSVGQTFCSGKLVESSSFVPILEGHVVRQVGCGEKFLIALLDPGRLLYFGANGAIEKLPLPDTAVKIVCGARHCVCLTEKRHVYTWGSDEKKQLGHGVSERVPKPRLLAGLSDIVDVAAGKSSSACVSALGVVTVWGAVAPKAELTVVEDLRGKNIFRVACSDRYVVGVSDLGRAFVWHPEAVADLALPSTTSLTAVLRSASVFQVSCSDSWLVALTDYGDVITWGDYGAFLGQGPRVASRRYADAPQRLTDVARAVRRVASSDIHVVAVTGEWSSKRDDLVWRLYCAERIFCRALYAVAEEYHRRIKIKDTPVFDHMKLLHDNHIALLREFTRLLETSTTHSAVPVGILYATCLSLPEVTTVYQSWGETIAAPIEKLSRPKLAAQLAEIEKEVEELVRKNDSVVEANKSFSLISLLRDPLVHLSTLNELLQELSAATRNDHEDFGHLQKAVNVVSNLCAFNAVYITAITSAAPSTPTSASTSASSSSSSTATTSTAATSSNASAVSSGASNYSSSAAATPSSSNAIAGTPPPTNSVRETSYSVSAAGPPSLNSSGNSPIATLRSASVVGIDGSDAFPEQFQQALKTRALQTELNIFQEANVQLVRYAKALEEELIQKTQLLEGSGVARAGLEGLAALEEELLDTARENAELRVRLKMLEYKAQLLEGTGGLGLSAASGGGAASSPSNSVSGRAGTPPPSASSVFLPATEADDASRVVMSKSRSANQVLSSQISPFRKGSSGGVGGGSNPASPLLRGSLMNSSAKTPASSSGGGGSSSLKDSGASSEDDSESRLALEQESLRKRLNPAAGRLLSEGEGGAARSLEQFTFDEGAKGNAASQGVLYAGSELKAATLEKLLEHLTQSSGSIALETFLLCYRNFANPQDIFRRLVYMYCVAPASKSKVVWLRLLNFLKNWVVKFWEEDWKDNGPLKADLSSFLNDIVQPCYANAPSTSAAVIAVETMREKLRRLTTGSDPSYPKPSTAPPIFAGEMNLDKFKPATIGEQLTLSEHEHFRAIKPAECFNQNWIKKNTGLSPNIVLLTGRFNKISRWISFEICSQADARDRRNAMEKFIAVAAYCRDIRSFGIVMAIMGALTSAAVYRLRKTWDTLSRSAMTQFNELKDFVSSDGNFANLREATRLADLPCFPYIGTFLGDLTFLDAGAQDFTLNGLVNWSKFQATASIIMQLQAKQKTPYSFDLIPEWQSFLYYLPDHSENDVFELSKRNESGKQ